MTRIFPLGDADPFIVPTGWDYWTLNGETFERRRDGHVYQWQNGWIKLYTEHVPPRSDANVTTFRLDGHFISRDTREP